MKARDFTIAFSDREQEDAVKEISLKIKSLFPKDIKHLIILYTPQYHPASILKTINLTLKPEQTLGLQAPFLIFEDKIISKGVAACCLNKETLEIKSPSSKYEPSKEVQSILNNFFKKLRGKGYYFFSFVSAQLNLLSYLTEIKLSLGKIFNFLGAGYVKQYSSYDPQIANNNLNDGLTSFAVKGVHMDALRLEGYAPLGKPFKITKVAPGRNLLMEIDGQPAVNIYRYYLEEKFDTFMKNRLFAFYPLGIKSDGTLRLVKVIESLEDGSLVCLGELKENISGNIMFLDSDLLFRNVQNKLLPLAGEEGGLVFIINSLSRKKILKEAAEEEVKIIKKTLGNRFKILGIYSDYYFFSDNEKGDINAETGNLLLTVWQ